MSRDLYTSLAGARSAWRQIEVTANNAANTDTVGFKQSRMAFRSIGAPDSGRMGEVYATPDVIAPAMTDGALHQTDNPMDVALQGDGWFVLESPGGVQLTRDGRFGLSPDGVLVNHDGRSVMGEGGMIEVQQGETLTINEIGEVVGSKSGYIDRLKLASGPAEPMGGNLWRPIGALEEAAPRVIQGAIESSNVDPMGAMVELIEASRHFEAFQKAMQASDEADQRINKMGGGG